MRKLLILAAIGTGIAAIGCDDRTDNHPAPTTPSNKPHVDVNAADVKAAAENAAEKASTELTQAATKTKVQARQAGQKIDQVVEKAMDKLDRKENRLSGPSNRADDRSNNNASRTTRTENADLDKGQSAVDRTGAAVPPTTRPTTLPSRSR